MSAAPSRRAVLGLLGAGLAMPALGQGVWPNRPIRIVVPSVTGGFDNYARLTTPRLTELLGQPVVIENKPGANGNIGMQEVQRAAPDGHTILFAAVGSLSINVSVYRGMPLDPIDDLAAVACPVTSPMVWVANPESGPRTLAELVERARAAPGKLDYALPSAGTINHLIAEGFKLRHNLDIPAVPYRGTPPAQLDVVAGRVPVMVDSLGAGWGHISAGRLRPLALTARERSPRAPEIPTAIELGLDQTDYVAWYAYMAPKATPPGIIARLNAALNQVALEDGYRNRLQEMGAATQAMTPEAQLEFMKAERKKWGDIARAANVEVV